MIATQGGKDGIDAMETSRYPLKGSTGNMSLNDVFENPYIEVQSITI